MIRLKSIHLENYCGYRDILFDFNDQMNIFIAPNGSGKSMLLNAIYLLSSASRFYGKNTVLSFRKYTYDPDYNPGKQELQIAMADLKRDEKGRIVIDNTKDAKYDPSALGLQTRDPEYLKNILKNLSEMKITGVFDKNNENKEVILKTSGVDKNELYNKESESFCYLIDADSPTNNNNFQIAVEYEKRFIDLAEACYGYRSILDNKVSSSGKMQVDKDDILFYRDFILQKPWGDRVHFKNMSGGEKKLATLLRYLSDEEYMNRYDIILIDNIEKEIYFKRHKQMVQKFLDTFPNKQFFVTTHSSVLPNEFPQYIFDIEEYKIDEAKRLGIELIYPDIQLNDASIKKLNGTTL